MKKTTLIIFAILLIVNLLSGLLLSSYKPFNVAFTSSIILVTGALLYLLQTVRLKDAFAISLAFSFSFLGIIEFILGILSPSHIQDNSYIITTVVLLAVEIIALIICNLSTKTTIK